jgi:AcrR family transcriptional regulator
MTRAGLDKAAVVAAAAAIADRDGADRLTLALLADELGVRAPSLYSHVEGLDGLRRDLLVYYLHMVAERLRRAGVGVARRDAVVTLAKEYCAFWVEHPGAFGLPVQRMLTDPEVDRAMADAASPLLQVLRNYGLDRQERGHWLRIIWTAAYGYALVRATGQMTIPADPDESFQIMVDAFADAIAVRASAAANMTEYTA